MHLFPAIDLIDGRVVRLTQGDYDQQTTYGDDPVAQARAFEQAGCEYLHVVDLDGARTGDTVNFPVIERICRQTTLTVEVGGGIRDEDTIKRYIGAGVKRLVLGTAALTQWDWFEQLAHTPTLANKLVLGLDARKGKLAIGGWKQTTEATALQIARQVTDWPLAGIVYTDISTDGTLEGPALQSTRDLAEATTVPIVASGGVGTLDDLKQLRTLPILGVIVGRALYENRFTPAEAVQVLRDGSS